MTGISSNLGLLLIGVYWVGMTGLVINNFTRTNDGQQTTYNGRTSEQRLEVRTLENGAQRTVSISPTKEVRI